jgi:Secretion system C-terminal sorting domain
MNFRTATFLIFLFLLLAIGSFNANAQNGSVELKDSLGVVISSHASIQSAYNAVPVTITQAYIIEILNTYTGANEVYPISLSVRNGSSAQNTITLRPALGNSGEVISAAASGQPILLLDDADYVIVDGRPGGIGSAADLTFENLATTSSSFTLRFLNGATNNIIRYCVIKNNTMNTAGPRAIEIGTSVSNPTGNSYNQILFNDIVGGRSGIGLAGTPVNLNLFNQIKNNKISNFGYSGIWVLSNSSNVLIEGNQIFQTIGYNTFNFGIIAASFSALDIVGNKIYDLQNTASTTLRGIQLSPAAGGTVNVLNNFISLMLDNGTKTIVTGINFIGTTDHTANVYYNSIRIGGIHNGGTSGSVLSAGIHKGSTGTGSTYNIKNNIVLNTRSAGTAGGYHTGFYLGSANNVGTLNVDYNVYYGIDSLSTHACWSDIFYSNISLYKTAANPNEQNSLFKPTQFVSGTDLHLVGTSLGDIDLGAIPIVGITTDIDNQLRDPILPYKGADEADVSVPVELATFNAFVNASSVTLNWVTATELNNKGFDIERKLEKNNWIKIGFVNGYGTTTDPTNYSFTDKDLNEGLYHYRLKQIDMNGSFKYYNLLEVVKIISPLSFNLAQNFPNPFNPITRIRYSVAESLPVKLIVFNSIGEEITTLVNEVKQPGNYYVLFDAKSLSSGIYFYKITAGDFVSTKKMILIK